MTDTSSPQPATNDDPGLGGVVVLGMHRSGTSAVNGLFHSAGFHVTSDEDLMDPTDHQPAGHNESWAVMRVNDEILAEIGRTWFEPPAEEEYAPVLESGRRRVAGLLSSLQKDAGPAPLALKDPRINVMMPVWAPLIDGLLHPVLVIRDPIEVARSLAKRDGTARPIALASWELCMTAALAHLSGRKVSVVHYRELIASPSMAVDIVGSVTAMLDARFIPHVDPDRAADQLNPSLHRNQASGPEHEHALTQHQADLWGFLNGLDGGMQTLSVPDEFTVADPETRAVAHAETERVELIAKLWAAEATPSLRRALVHTLEPLPGFRGAFPALRVVRDRYRARR